MRSSEELTEPCKVNVYLGPRHSVSHVMSVGLSV